MSEENKNPTDKKKRKFFTTDEENLKGLLTIENIDVDEEELWDEIGLHKAIGGSFFRNFVFMLIGAVISVVTFTFVLQQLIPYPTSKGYYDISQSLFSFVFLIFDVGTAYGIERFIAEYQVKDKRKMLHYIQFYIWYQCLTGLIQVTFISIWVLYTVPQGNLAHLGWILLIINIKQYPGMLGTFNSVLKGFQRYDKTIIIDFIGTQGFQFITQIIFFIGGRYWGMANPNIGELLGLSIGMVLGFYIDDFFTMILAMHYFGKVTKQFGFTQKDAWRHDFDWVLVKECLRFGIGISWAPLIGVGLGLIKLQMSLNQIPGYSTWIVLAGLGSGIGASINMGDINIGSPISESINNGKMELSNFYISQAFKYWGFILFAMGGIITVLLPVLTEVLFIIPDVAQQYQSTLVFIIPGMLAMILDVPIKQFERVITASGKVMLKSTTEIFINILSMVLWYLALYEWQLWEVGQIGVIILFVLLDFPGKVIKFGVYYFFIHTRLLKVRISVWQTFVAPFLTYFAVFLFGYLFVYGMFLPMLSFNMNLFGDIAGAIATAVFGLLVILIGFMIILFPILYALFGGWDEFGLEVLRKSYLISGPSKPFVKIIYKLSVYGSKISPLYNKHIIPHEIAAEEAAELLEIKRLDQKSLDEELGIDRTKM